MINKYMKPRPHCRLFRRNVARCVTCRKKQRHVSSSPDFKVTPSFDAEYLRNGTRYRHSFRWNTNRDLHNLYSRVSFRVTLSDLKWLSEIFNGMKRSAVSLRRLSFLFGLSRARDRYVHVLCIFVAMSILLNAATVLFAMAPAPICNTDQFPAL